MNNDEFRRLSSFYFLFYAVLGAFVPYRGRYLAEQGFDSVTIGISMASISALTIFSPLIWAYLADRFHATKRIMLLGGCLAFFACASVYYQTTAVLMIASTASYAIAWAAVGPLSESLTLARVHSSGGDYNRIRLWGSIGYIVTVLSVGYGVQYWGVWTVVPTTLAAIVFLVLIISRLPDANVVKRVTDKNDSVWSHLFAGPVWVVMLVCLLVAASHTPFYTFFDLFLRGHGYAASISGWLITLGVVAEIVLFYFAKRLMAYWAFERLFLLAVALSGLRWFLLALFASFWPVLLFVQLLHAVSFALMHSMAMLTLHQSFPPAMHARAQALYGTLVYGVGGVIGNLLSGWMWQNGEGGTQTYLLSSAYCVMGVLLFLFLYKRFSLRVA